MKILIAITKGEIGGAQSFVLALARGLKASNTDVSVAVGEGDYLPEKLEGSGIPCYRLDSLKRSHNPLKAIAFIFELRRLIDTYRFDVLHLNSSNALLGAISAKLARHKVRTIFTVHGLSVLDDNYRANIVMKYLFKLFFRSFFRLIDRVVFVSKYNLEAARKKGIIESGELIYNGLDLPEGYFLSQVAAREELRKMVGVDMVGNYVIGSIGRLAYPKNYELLIEAFAQIKKARPEAKGIIIGEGPEREKYEDIIKRLGLEKDFFLVGAIEEASRFVKAFDVFVLPSWYEGLSISLIEAVSAKVPAIASKVGGNMEVIGEGNCFDLDDYKGLSDKILNGRMRVMNKDNFSLANMVNGYLRIYEI